MSFESRKLSEEAMVDSVDSSINLMVEKDGEIRRMAMTDLPQQEVVQPDWEETNENNPSYIKNKPDLSSIGGGNASVEVYTFTNVSTGDLTDSSGAVVTAQMAYDAMLSGTIRIKIGTNICTVIGLEYNTCGAATLYFTHKGSQVGSASVNGLVEVS